jgi:hypothetical protein
MGGNGLQADLCAAGKGIAMDDAGGADIETAKPRRQ